MKIETLVWNWKLSVAAEFKAALQEKLRNQHFSRIDIHESSNTFVAVLYSGEGKADQSVEVFGPGELDDIVARLNAVTGEAAGKLIEVTPLAGSRRFVGTIICSPLAVEEVASGKASQGQNQKPHKGSKPRKQRGDEQADRDTPSGGAS